MNDAPELIRRGTLNGIADITSKYGGYNLSDLMNGKAFRDDLKTAVLEMINTEIDLVNAVLSAPRKVGNVKALPAYSAGEILLQTGDFRMIQSEQGGADQLVMRQRDGKAKGTWKVQDRTNSAALNAAIRCLNPTADNTYRKEVRAYLEESAPPAELCRDSKVVFCENGVYSFYARDAGYNPFVSYDDVDFEQYFGDYVVLSKLATAYNKNAVNVHIHNDMDGMDWDVESHLKSPFSDKASEKIWLEIAHFAVRGDSGGRGWWLMNAAEGTQGNAQGGNGKNGQTDLLCYTIGVDNVLKTPVEKLSDNYQLGELPGKMAIISDETSSTVKAIDDCAVYKNLTRGQPVVCRKIYGSPFVYTFKGAMIQCMNGTPKVTEKTDSFYRKIEVIRFEKEFVTEGKERKYINEEYIKRQDVREYFLKKLLDMPCLEHYTDEYIEALGRNKSFLRASSSPVFEFMEEVAPVLILNIVPFDLLWDVFRIWERENKIHYQQEKKQFKSEVRQWTRQSEEWDEYTEQFRVKAGTFEPILNEYCGRGDYETAQNIKRWVTQDYYGNSLNEFSAEARSKNYRGGIIRTAVGENYLSQKKAREEAELRDGYDRFCGWWVSVYFDILVKGSYKDNNGVWQFLTKADMPSYEKWLLLGKPYYNKASQLFEVDGVVIKTVLRN